MRLNRYYEPEDNSRILAFRQEVPAPVLNFLREMVREERWDFDDAVVELLERGVKSYKRAKSKGVV